MREGITAPDLALLLGTGKRFFRVRVKRWDDAGWTNLSDLGGGDWTLRIQADGETPDQPASRFSFTLLHSADSESLAPGISGSDHNYDAVDVFRPLIHPGRDVEISVAVIASGTPVSGDWKPWLRGQIEDVDWPGLEVVASCLTLDGLLTQAQIESEEDRSSDSSPVAVEDEIQALLDRWRGPGVVTLRVIGTPGWAVGAYTPAKGSLGAQLLELAQQNGWDLRYRWSQSDGDFRLTFYEPPRDKTDPDLELTAAQVYDVPGLQVSRKYIRNAFAVEYLDAATGARKTETGEDPASIEEYDRQFMSIVEADDSPVDSAASAAALIDFAKHDLALPLAEARKAIPFLPWIEVGDLVAVAADGQHYDYDTSWAVVGTSHQVDSEAGCSTTFDGRGGQPIGMSLGWFKREKKQRPPDEVERGAEILNFREISRTSTTIKYGWTLGSGLALSAIHDYKEAQPYSEDKWPAEGDDPLVPARLPDSIRFERNMEYTVTIPEQGQVGYFQVEGRKADGSLGNKQRALIFPSNIAGDYIAFASVTVNQTDGSVKIAGWTTDRAQSLAYAYNVGAATVAAPTEAQAEAQGVGATGGGLLTGFTSDFEVTLPASTVAFGEVIKVLLIAYINADGTGPDGTAQDHHTPVGAQGERFKVTLEGQILDGVVIAKKLREGSRGFNTDIVFDAVDWDTVSWEAGTIYLADGVTSYSIAAGNTGNLASDAPRWIYFDKNISTTQLQVTTAAASAVGEDAILICVAWRASGGSSSGQEAGYVPSVGVFGINADVVGPKSIREQALQDLAVTEAKIADAAVATAKIAFLAVTNALLAAGAVTTTKVSDDAITTPKLAAGAVTAAKITAGTITSNEIAALTIVAGNIAAATITGAKIAAATITAANIQALTITAAEIAANTITAAKIAAATITAAQIAGLTITASEIAANTITAGKLNVASLSAISVDVGTLTAGVLQNAAGTRFINLSASGANPFIKHDAFTLLADGTATFAGTVSASAFTASTATFDGSVEVKAGEGATRVLLRSQGGGNGEVQLSDSTSTVQGGIQAASGFLTVIGSNEIRISSSKIGFYSAAGVTKQVVTGSRGGNAALASLLTALATVGLITDSSS